ncbi:MAG: FAD-binding oxidoreductase [Planctomycetota bacterium]
MTTTPRESRFAALTDRHLDTLVSIVGDANVVRPGDDTFDRYTHDETEKYRFPPAVGVRAETADQIAEVLKLATAERLPVTPWGAGTGLSGAALAVFGGISLSLERMNRIIDIDLDNMFVVTQPGVITQVLQEAVQQHGLYYPPDPASRGSCTIGGNIVMNSGGMRCVKYGVTKDYVAGLRAVLADGTPVGFGGRRMKDVAGYNMVQTLVGSEGTLAVITEATLRLIPYPTHRRLLLAPFASYEAAAACVAAIFRRRITPSAVEFLDQPAIRCTSKHMGKTWPAADDCAAQLMIEVDGFHEDVLDGQVEVIAECCMEAGSDDVILADTAQREADLWAMRRVMGEAVKSLSTYKEEDTCVPRARLPELVRGVKDICARHGITLMCYGHAGDGNLHQNLLQMDLPDDEWKRVTPGAITEIFELTVALGGTITGEHGVGWVQRQWLPVMQSPAEIALQRRVKDAFDPAGILNPGKVFPD